MDRGWYARFSVVVVVTALAWLAFWPTLDKEGVLDAPRQIRELFPNTIAKGLDIQGGLRLMYEVDVDKAITDRRDRLVDLLKERLAVELDVVDEDRVGEITREQLDQLGRKVRIERTGDRRMTLTFTAPGDIEKASHDFLQRTFPEIREVERSGSRLVLAIRDDQMEKIRESAVEQAVKTVSNRVDELQIKEASVYGNGTDLVVEVPGANDADFERIRSVVAQTARLEFKVVDDEGSAAFIGGLTPPEGIETSSETASAGESRPSVSSAYLIARGEDSRERLQTYLDTLTNIPDDHQLAIGRVDRNEDEPGQDREEGYRTYYLYRTAEVTGEDVEDALVSYDQQNANKPVVSIAFNPTGAASFERLTGRNVKRRMAIVLDNKVESAPVINERIAGGRCQITLGAYMRPEQILQEANDLVVVLRAGALPAPIRPSNEQLIGPSLGADAVVRGIEAALACLLITIVFMAIYYEVGGLVANVMVLLNVLLVLATLAFFEATLTLPGIAGLALTVAMSVDANVLINERIREELRLGKSPRSAVDQGFKQAFWSIFDGQITTLIAGIVLFQYGTGPIKGFAVTMMIGLVTSLFTGVFCSRVLMEWIVRGLRVQRLRVG